MTHVSDNLTFMKTMTATEASRAFSALLDDVENGETVVITRGGKRIATLGPASQGNGAEVLAFLTHAEVDPGFAADVSTARDPHELDVAPWPED